MNVPAAARSIARPPATEPVKLQWSTRPGGEHARGLLVAEDEVAEQALRQAGGVHRRLEALARRGSSATACLSSTALPATRAGTIVLTAVRYG